MIESSLPASVVPSTSCFIVRDHNGQALSYVYYEQEPGRRAAAEVRRIATSIARLPELLSAAAKQDPNPLFAPEALMRQNPSKTKFCDG